MSPTSSESSFRRVVEVTLVTLTVVCGVLFGLGALQGPKLQGGRLDVAHSLSPQVRLEANQPVAEVEPSQVQVTPAVPFAVATSGSVIAVTFAAPLDWNTDYSITVGDVRSPSRNSSSTFDFSFSTSDAAIYYLDRRADTGEDDRIYRAGIADTARSLVYSAPSIMDFAVTSSALAVVTRSGSGADGLSLVDSSTGIVETVIIPDNGVVTAPRVSDSGSTLGFVFTSLGDGEYSRILFTIDLVRGRELRPAVGLAGEPLSVLEWRFVPRTETMAVLASDRSLALVDPSSEVPLVPLGNYLGIGHVSSDGLSITADDDFGFSSITFADLAEERLRPSGGALVDDAQVLRNGDTVQLVYRYDQTSLLLQGYLVRDDGSAATVLFGDSGSPATILGFSVSANEQYVAVEIDPNSLTSQSDEYIGNTRPIGVTTLVIDLTTGVIVSGYEGLALAW